MKEKIWLSNPEEHDYDAAFDFLSLLISESKAKSIVIRLKKSKPILRKAKDILRASDLPLLPKDNVHVKEDLSKVKHDKKLSPILLVRAERLIIADGYHRVCAIYYLSEDTEVPCRLVDIMQ